MRSMTGYGSSRIKNRQLEIEIHVKSVNGRFLEIRFHLPKEYSPFENDLRKAFGTEWARGTVDVYVHRRALNENRLQAVHLRKEYAKHWAKVLRGLNAELKFNQDIHLRDILQMPFVMEHQDRAPLLPNELKVVEGELRKATVLCQKLRSKEGSVLKKELLTQLKNLEDCIKSMNGLRDEAAQNVRQRIQGRLSDMGAEPLDPSRLALETALLIDKMDVHEEVVRLLEHVKACRSLVQASESEGTVGKKLDFYCQELLREVNTIGSKSQLAALTQVVVRGKSVIEKFREQVQNIE